MKSLWIHRTIRVCSCAACPLISLLLSAPAQAQALQGPSGRVSGHVYCSDTNAPAKFATVTLQPVPSIRAANAAPPADQNERTGVLSKAVSTGLDGAFTIDEVKPGLYYVVAQFPGYIFPISQFSDEELAQPTAEIRRALDQSLPRVRVDASQSAHVEVQLQRGAALSGTIRYDDGSPAVDISVELLHRQEDKSWGTDSQGTVTPMLFGYGTDDVGHFRIAGLNAGEVIVKCTLILANMDIEAGTFMGPPNSVAVSSEQTVAVYSGGVFRDKDATPIKLTTGSDNADGDILIPLAKLHTVSGIVTAANDGHPLSGGQVKLLYPDNNAEAHFTRVQPDGSFHLTLVPEGDYLLAISDAGDGEYSARGVWKKLVDYADFSQPLNVHGEVSDLVATAKPKSAAPTTSQ
jgi:hypothetical protein